MFTACGDQSVVIPEVEQKSKRGRRMRLSLHKSVVAPSPELGGVGSCDGSPTEDRRRNFCERRGRHMATDPHPGPCLSSHEAKGTDILLASVASDHPYACPLFWRRLGGHWLHVNSSD